MIRGAMKDQSKAAGREPSRRDFVKTATVAAAAATAAMSIPKGVYAAGSGTIKVGLVGCGGRGTGAAQNALHAGPDIKLVAMGDMFQDKLDEKVEDIELQLRSLVLQRVGDVSQVPSHILQKIDERIGRAS